MRLQEYEDKIRELWEQDNKSEEMFKWLDEFCHEFFRRKHLMNNKRDSDEAASIMAETLYLKLAKGEPIYHLMGYCGLCYHEAIGKFLKMNSHEVIDVRKNPQLGDAIIQMSSSNINESTIRESTDRNFIQHLPEFIEGILQNSQYEQDSSDYLNSKMTIYLSFIKGSFCKYSIANEDLEYTKMLYQVTMSKLRKELSYNIEPDQLGGLSPLQLYTLETYVDKEMNEDFYE